MRTQHLHLVIAVWATPALALACGPELCIPKTCLVYGRGSLYSDDNNICESNSVPHLDPQNYTGTNFEVLEDLLSARPETNVTSASPQEVEPLDPVLHFEKLARALVPVDEKVLALVQLRKKIEPYPSEEKVAQVEKEIEASSTLASMPGMKSYLEALLAFYARKFDAAGALFDKASQDSNPALSEAAIYLKARSLLLASQADWDGYKTDPADPRHFRPMVNQEQVKSSALVFTEFLKRFPKSDWADSAKKILSGRIKRFTETEEEYWKDWNESIDRGEIHSKLIEVRYWDPTVFTSNPSLHPILWPIRAYYVTRRFPVPNKDEPKTWESISIREELSTLEMNKARFKKYPQWFAISKAVLLLGTGNGKEGLAVLEKEPALGPYHKTLTYQILVARLLIQMKEYDRARGAIRSYLQTVGEKPAPEIAAARRFYALTFHWQGKVLDAFSPETFQWTEAEPLKELSRDGLKFDEYKTLLNKKLPETIRAAIEEISLTKLLVNQKWQNFLEVWPEIEDPLLKKKFGTLFSVARKLASGAEDASSLFQFGDFVSKLEPRPEIYAPCNQNRLESGLVPASIALFQKSEVQFQKKAGANDPLEAKLLFTMIHCFKDSYSAPYCFGYKDGVPQSAYGEKEEYSRSERQKWFKRLHRLFPKSREAQETKVFW